MAADALSLSMSFGFSVGDLLAGANLAYRLIHALSETRGARMEYQEVIHELGCIQQTFLHVEHMNSSNIFCQANLNAISYIMNSSIDVMARFLEQTEKYRQSLSGNGGQSLAIESWRKIGWSLFKKGRTDQPQGHFTDKADSNQYFAVDGQQVSTDNYASV